VSATTSTRPGARVAAHAAWETRLLMRNGEQLLLTLVIPVAILLVLALTDILAPADAAERLPRALATVLSVSVVSAAFASLAIATGFERRSGVLRFLGTTPLSRSELLTGKFAATAIVTLLSAGVVTVMAVLLGWRPSAGAAWSVPALLLGTAAFAAWGMALAGLLRAEAVLAVANGVFLALLMFGGIVIPAADLPGPMAAVVPWLPSGALVDCLTAALVDGSAPGAQPVLVLVAWLIAGATLSARTFRWS
jgi:ABC-2 type transport system permease protein